MNRTFAVLATVVCIISLTACQPASPPPATAQPTAVAVQPTAAAAQPTAVSVQPTVAGTANQVTINFLGAFTQPSDIAGINKIISMFEAKYPNIKINMSNMQGSDLDAAAATLLTSSSGPDVVVRNPGPGFAGVWAKAGQLLPLDKYAQQYDWKDRILPIALSQATFDGHIYGIANSLEFAGVFYNKALFTKLGLSVPKTYDDLLAMCQKAKDNGLVAFAFADKDQWEADVQFATVYSNLVGPDAIDNILHSNGRWDTADVAKAIQIPFVDMYKAGCYETDPSSVAWEDGNTLFWSGKALMEPTGTWLISEIPADFDAGFFFYPSITGGKGVYPAADLGGGYWISAKTQHPDESAQWLDYMFSTEAAKVWMEDLSTIPPVKVDSSSFNLKPLFKDALQTLQTQPTGYNFDPLLPANFVADEGSGFQAVMLGEKTPADMAAALEKDWEDALAAGQTFK